MKSLIYDKIRLGVAVLLYLCATSWADAKVKLPALISDGMVLQREQSIKVWGTADAGESITVKFQKRAIMLPLMSTDAGALRCHR